MSNLRVWKDADSDGVTDEGELHTLDSLGITGFNVARTENNRVLSDGNAIADLGSYIRTDGTTSAKGSVTGGMADIDLADNPFYREFPDTIPLTEEAKLLPDMTGSGSVRNLREAASISPELSSVLATYDSTDTKSGQLAQLDNLITEWAETSTAQTSVEQAAAQAFELSRRNAPAICLPSR